MHPAAFNFVMEHIGQTKPPVLEFGSIDINGNVRGLFPANWYYLGIDEVAGPNVDILVDDMATWQPPTVFETVVSTEVLEHRADAEKLFKQMADIAGHALILTCAGQGRQRHARNGTANGPEPGEWYANIETFTMQRWILESGFAVWEIRHLLPQGDLQVFARRVKEPPT
jgi:hypothetical protein